MPNAHPKLFVKKLEDAALQGGNSGSGEYLSTLYTVSNPVAGGKPTVDPAPSLGPVTSDYRLSPSTSIGEYAGGINDHGQVVGTGWTGGSGFLYDRGAYTSVEVPSASFTSPEGINERGDIAGWCLIGSPHGFIYSNDAWQILDFPGAGSTYARDVNELGQVIGSYYNGWASHAFLYQDGSYTEIGPSSSIYTVGLSINAHGDVVGMYNDGAINHGFLLRDGVYTDIDHPLGVGGSQATGINDKGQILGNFTDATGNHHNFIYSDGVYTTINDGPYGLATAINDSGQIAGSHGFLVNPVATAGEPWVGGNGNQTYNGTPGDDTISGGSGKDILNGRAGSDIVSGDNGNDLLNGGPGNDWLTGGKGFDTFVFDPGFGQDVIKDLTLGTDLIQIDRALFSDFAGMQSHIFNAGPGPNTMIAYDDYNTITVLGVTPSQLTASDFKFV